MQRNKAEIMLPAQTRSIWITTLPFFFLFLLMMYYLAIYVSAIVFAEQHGFLFQRDIAEIVMLGIFLLLVLLLNGWIVARIIGRWLAPNQCIGSAMMASRSPSPSVGSVMRGCVSLCLFDGVRLRCSLRARCSMVSRHWGLFWRTMRLLLPA